MKRKYMMKWLGRNKTTLLGIIGVIVYYLDDIFQLCEKFNIPGQLNFGIATVLLIIVINSIRGKGLEKIDFKLEIKPKFKAEEYETEIEDEPEDETDDLDTS